MKDALFVVDVQVGLLNKHTQHIPSRIAKLIQQAPFSPVILTNFVLKRGSAVRKFTRMDRCTNLADAKIPLEIRRAARMREGFGATRRTDLSASSLANTVLTYPNVERVNIVGLDTDVSVLKAAIAVIALDLEPIVLTDCCASSAGPRAHWIGLEALARNIGLSQLRESGIDEGSSGFISNMAYSTQA